jgi:hypothetical protein
MPLALKRLILLTSITVALAADKDKPKLEINPAASYPHHMTSQGVTIAAVPYETEAQTKTAFGKVNPNVQGVLPILVVVENSGPNTIRVDHIKLEYVAQGDVRVENTPAQDLKYLRGPNEPKMSPGPVGGVHVSRNKNPLAEWEIEGRAFTANMVTANDKAGGFFYFQTAPRGNAKLIVSGLSDTRSGKELFFFEIPLQ